MKRISFTFYSSWSETISRIPDSNKRCAMYESIINYALFGQSPKFSSDDLVLLVMWDGIKPILDKQLIRSRVNAMRKDARGGAPKGNDNACRADQEICNADF